MLFRSLVCALMVLLMSVQVLAAPAAAGASSPGGAAGIFAQPDYVLQPTDLIQVDVFQEPDLQRQVRISQEATVTLPLIGLVNLKGKTIHQAQQLIASLYNQSYLVNPQVNITVLDYAKLTVNVLGSVNNPGAIPIPPEQSLNLLDAIARAGGFSRLADRKHVKLMRTDDDGNSTTIIINADDIIQGRTNDLCPLRKDDVIFVPERIL